MKQILSILMVLALTFSLAACNSKNTNNNTSTTKEPEAVAFGDSGESGNWKIKIKQVEETEKIAGHTPDEDVVPADKFVVILMDLTNISKDPISYSLIDFKLKDTTTGKTYAIQDNGVEASIRRVSEEKSYKNNQNYITLNDYVNPDDTKIGCVVFDTSKELKLDNLVLLNENDGSADGAVTFKLQ